MATLRCVEGDITESDCEAIVNAADHGLSGGAGVDGAIHRAAGPAFTEECRELVRSHGGCPTGDAVITSGGDLAARYVIHTVGPVWEPWQQWGGQLDDGLAGCYRTSLDLATKHSVRSVAFPNISTGVYKFPKDRAACIAIDTTREWVDAHPTAGVDDICFVCLDAENLALYQSLLEP